MIAMTSSRAAILSTSTAWAVCLAFSVLVRAEGPQATPTPPASGQTLTPEEIFEFQNSQEQAGSAEAGRALFEKLCASCHRFGEAIGKDVGPDLTTITSRFKKRDVLEAILWPSKVISDQYKSEMFEMKDGAIVSGVVVRENAANVFVRTAESPERPVPVPKAQIASRAESTVSLMPPGLLDGYSQVDISNLVAFIMTPPPAK
jgi:putative heme-binding domain-containing protein